LDGSVPAGWPVTIELGSTAFRFFGTGAPTIGDIDADGRSDVIVSIDASDYSRRRTLAAYRHDGTPVAGFPRPTPDVGSSVDNGALLADLDKNGTLDMAWASLSGELAVYELGSPATAVRPWPMFQSDAGLSGAFTPASTPPQEVVALSRSIWTATATSNAATAVNALDGNLATRWDTQAAQTNGQSITVDMKSPQTFSQITLDAGSSTNDYPRGYQVFISNDGVNFGTAIATGSGTGRLITITFSQRTAQFVRIVQTGTSASWWSLHELNVYGPPAPPTALSRSGWTASATSNGAAVPNALDGNAATRWDSQAVQSNGQSFTVDMKAAQTFTRVTLDSGSSANDYPRGYQVFVSNDGVSFGSAIASGVGTNKLVTISFAQQTARYLRIVQTGTASSWWSIHELNVYGTTTGSGILPRTGWVASASSGASSVGSALDGVASSRWTSGATQVNGQWFQVDMRAAQTFRQLTLDATGSAGDYPRGYQVFVSNDGSTWGSPVATGAGTAGVTTVSFATRSARYVRIVQTGSASSWWSLHELNVVQ
jgi:hypothetical protein